MELTCEIYCVDRLIRTEEELRQAKAIIKQQDEDIKGLQSKFDKIKSIARIEYGSAGKCDPFIKFENVWKEYDKKDFAELLPLLGLSIEEEGE